MKIFFNPTTLLHQPKFEFFNVKAYPHADSVVRARSIYDSLRAWPDAVFKTGQPISLDVVQKIHAADYVLFLRRVANHKARIYPSVFNAGYLPPQIQSKYNLEILAGNFVADTYTPFSSLAVRAALASAGCARSAAQAVAAGERVAYTLCRPPGHHASSDRASGYCYLNNAGIAAQELSARGKRVAIIDFDYHHGNGTQEIFYTRKDVLYVSLHAQPEKAFPHFAGFASEKGEGVGRGYTYNLPLPLDIRDDQYLAQMKLALRRVRTFAPQYLVVSAGFDIHWQDPVGLFRLGDKAIASIGSLLAQLSLPTVIVQEGGYNPKTIGRLVRMFLERW